MITMRKWIIIFFLFIVLPCNVLFADWTIMLYLDADNDLKQYTDEIFSDIAKVGSLAGQVNIVALYDRTYDTNNPGDWTDTRRGIIQTNDIVNNWGTSMGELNMGHPQTLINFVNWATTTYPENNYSLILYDHGSGWQKSICQDAFSGTITVSNDNGASWSQISEYDGIANDHIQCLYVLGTTLYAGTNEGLSISYDNGNTWNTFTTLNGLPSNSISCVFATPTTIYAGTYWGLSVSTDNGNSWTTYTTANGLRTNNITCVYVAGTTIYAGNYIATTDSSGNPIITGALSVSTNNGTSWVNYTGANGLGSEEILSVRASGSEIYVGTTNGVSVSLDNGNTWTNRTTTDGLGNNRILDIFITGSTIYAGTGHGVSVSNNQGNTWINHAPEHRFNVSSVYAAGATIYAGTTLGLFISQDSGLTWDVYETAEGIGGDNISSVYANGSNIYTGSVGSDYLSLKELGYALNQTGITIDLLGFNACLMGMTEVMYEIKDYCDYVLASEETEDCLSWAYEATLTGLVNNPNISPVDFGNLIVSNYLPKSKYLGEIALSDCSQINSLVQDVDTLAQTLQTSWNSDINACINDAQTVMSGINATVLNKVNCSIWYASHGLSINFPKINEEILPNYNGNNILFLQDTQWDEFLSYFKTNMSGSWVESAKNQAQIYTSHMIGGIYNNFKTYTDLYDFCRNLVYNVPDDLQVDTAEDFFMHKKKYSYNHSSGTTYTLTNNGSNSMPFTVTKSEQWVDISPVSGTLNPGASTDITITFDNSTNTFDYGVNVCELNFTNSNTGVTRQREVALNVPIIDSFVEEFDPSNPNPVDFENSMIVFTPDGTETYKMWTAEADRLPVNPAGGEQLDFTSDFSHQRPLNPGDSFPFFGNNYQTLYISKKGAINFEMSVWEAQYEETIWPSNIDYFVTRKRVCGFGADMVPESGGTVTWQVLADRAVVTFEDVPIKNELSNINTFQMELFYSGQIRFTYLNIDDDSPVIGLNGGELVLQNTSWHGESDISAYYHIGDVNGDEAITIVDALMTAHYSDGLDPAPFNPHLADVDGDGDIDLDDAYTINYYVVGLIDEFPCQYN